LDVFVVLFIFRHFVDEELSGSGINKRGVHGIVLKVEEPLYDSEEKFEVRNF
jgi:hypothetical protein